MDKRDAEALALINKKRAEGWSFELLTGKSGWTCNARGRALAHANHSGRTLAAAVLPAVQAAERMVDDPQKWISQLGAQIETLAKDTFGANCWKGLEPVYWEPESPVKIMIKLLVLNDQKKHVELESQFYHQAFRWFPRELVAALTFELEYSEDKKGPTS